METETLMLRGIQPRLKGKIAKRVAAEGSNMNDVLVGILADVYEVPFEPTGVRRIRVGASSQALLTVPAELKRRIQIEAAEANDTIRNIAMQVICDAFEVPYKATGRWAKRRAVAA